MIVVDASLATKWLLVEADSDAALGFLKTYEARVCAPDLLALEVSRALVTAANMRRIENVQARGLLQTWLHTVAEERIALHPTLRYLGRGADIALDLGHPLPDCIYLAMAIELDCPLATADRKFAEKATPVYDRIELVGTA